MDRFFKRTVFFLKYYLHSKRPSFIFKVHRSKDTVPANTQTHREKERERKRQTDINNLSSSPEKKTKKL